MSLKRKNKSHRRRKHQKKFTRRKRGGTPSVQAAQAPAAAQSPVEQSPAEQAPVEQSPAAQASAAQASAVQRYQSIASHINEFKMQGIQRVCPDTGICLALGIFSDEIKQYFDFIKFDNAVNPITRIGKISANGFVNQIKYIYKHKRTIADNPYESYAILKSAQTKSADNLLYEYNVGQYINKLNKQYPCFLETYGLYKYKTEQDWINMGGGEEDKKGSKKSVTRENEKNISVLQGLERVESGIYSTNYALACNDSKHLSVLIQHFNHFESLSALLQNPAFVEYELLWILFQLYIPLANLKDTFTHYDLHLNNVYLYKPVINKYIEYHYHIDDTLIVTFKSCYMMKIIDYGRSYFNDIEDGMNSVNIYNDVCNAPECNLSDSDKKNCGHDFGFYWFGEKKSSRLEEKRLSPNKSNASYDLQTLVSLEKKIDKKNIIPSEMRTIIIKLVSNVSKNYDGLYKPTNVRSNSTKKTQLLVFPAPPSRSIMQRLLNKPANTIARKNRKILKTDLPIQINNVQDAADWLTYYVTTIEDDLNGKEDHYIKNAGKDGKLGDLHVYMDGRPMNFIPDETSTDV